MGRQAERSESTRAGLVAAARELFAERGYAAVGTPEVVEHAGSSRGALYHHFKDKRELFRAVYIQIEQEIVQQVTEALAAERSAEPIAALQAGLRTFLTTCVEPERVRIMLIDAPSVLGWQEWRSLDEQYGLGLIMTGLEAGVDAGALRWDIARRPAALMILSALGEAALYIANAEDREIARQETEPTILALLDGLRTR
ncbi:TetR/AcrR family transcriptional regulator [Nocardia sp. NPDC051570]|uniref:TetR/AcrR family transcriptional regulator n=1 Tax=Nocardia sp. NPDC051570 TaxID=3364324 RepID=UPI0037BBDB8B